jgi:hypothetical protein
MNLSKYKKVLVLLLSIGKMKMPSKAKILYQQNIIVTFSGRCLVEWSTWYIMNMSKYYEALLTLTSAKIL